MALSDERVRAALAEARVIPGSEGDGPATTEIERAFRGAGLLPDSQTPVTAVVGTQDGRIWLRREETGADTVAWTVVEREGRVRGEIHLPAGQLVLAAEDDLLVALELDELDVPYLVRYRLGGS